MAQRIACILGDGFEDSEFRVPYDRLVQAGYEVDVIGAKKQPLEGKAGKEKVTPTKTIDEVRPEDYQALFIPGGYSPDHIRADKRFVNFVKAFDQAKKLIFAVCHGPQLFLSAGIVKGRTLTAWQTVQDDLRLAGANVLDEQVVEDGNWITSRKPDDLKAFSDAVLNRLKSLGAEEAAVLH